MARIRNRLTARYVATATEAGRHADGGSLYLVIDKTKDSIRRRWLYMYVWQGKRREMGLGGFPAVSLADARRARDEAERLARAGKDPITVRNSQKMTAQRKPTFGEIADHLIASKESEWRNEKHRAQWRMTLREYAGPLRDRAVDDVGTADVLSVLKPLWIKRPETASRLRGRIEAVLDAAKAQGLRGGENPAAWRGHLVHLLPRRQKLTRGHHAAMPYDRVPAFIVDLRGHVATAALALEFCILTAARSGEVLGARWSEVDLKDRVWSVPAERMKAAREHRVPLSDRAMAILRHMSAGRVSEFVFPGQRSERPLSVMAMEMVLRRMKISDATVHGFRSSFRDWAGNETEFPRELAEAALAHVIGNAAEQAYRRGDALEKRRSLMTAWEEWCSSLRHEKSSTKHKT